MNRTVLIVEDTEPGRDMLEMALMHLPGIEIHAVGTAEEAMDFLASPQASAPITALVTDLNLPQMDGFQLIEAVRAQPRWSELPIVVISGNSDPRTLDRVVSLGASAYFPKPYSPAQVRQKLEELIDAP